MFGYTPIFGGVDTNKAMMANLYNKLCNVKTDFYPISVIRFHEIFTLQYLSIDSKNYS